MKIIHKCAILFSLPLIFIINADLSHSYESEPPFIRMQSSR